MKIINKSKTNTKLIVTLVVVGLVAVGAGFGYFYFTAHKSTTQTAEVSKTDLNPPSNDQISAGNDSKTATVNPSGSDTTKGDQGTTSSDLAITITAANQSNNLLQIRTLIQPVVSSSAICTLTMTKAADSVTQTSDTQALASNSTCKGFNVETSNLSKGDWLLTIKITDGTKSNSVSKTITLS